MNPKAPCPAEVRLRYGVTPEAGPGLVPGMCASPAHDRENLGLDGRRVPVGRRWSGKTLTEHPAGRREVVAQVLAAAGIEAQTRTGSTPTTPPTSPSSPHPYARPRPGEASTSTPRPAPRDAAHHLWTPIRQLAQRHEAREEADMEPHELMTTEEVAEHFRVNPSTVRRWRLDGVGPRFVKIGSVYRYPRVHLSEWIAARIGDRVAS